MIRVRVLLLLALSLLSGCALEGIRTQSATAPAPLSEEQRLQSRIAWLLLEADEAMARQQLTTPEGDNALNRYQDVLRLQPGNLEAQQGLQRIVDSYLGWARSAMGRGDLAKAQVYLDRARLVSPNSPKVIEAQARLAGAGAVDSADNEFPIDPAQLRQRSAKLAAHLAEVGRKVELKQAVFLIIAPRDVDGRWIFQQMQQGATGRLRGNFEIGSQPRVRLQQKPGSNG
ncbi:tetratricopeptide repeat protein [Aestuariirhabdus litorea]|uniref:Tetratricopeptide repeat protein n=1 Tax=Aestuariirhabdus litorea TaxID=2528527 RepID=A0A3P3VPQ3_9GAMM|nr:hypothetical protein [Aestuariirhabdus litorea]RRJ83636.1 hypothetical protein D0544_00480 [Aestuariirhabdus litorea]RWW96857.1 hypothetical protein DZC74_00480 [Endozoicomonadaceae bacterium GTF-13]